MKDIVVALMSAMLMTMSVGEGAPLMALPWLVVLGYALWNHEEALRTLTTNKGDGTNG